MPVALWCSLLLVCLHAILSDTVVLGLDYYVTPSLPPSPDCNKFKECHTLEYYAVNSSHFFYNKSNVSLIFFNGTHSLTTKLESSNVTFFHMKSFTSDMEVNLTLSSGGEVAFNEVDTLVMTTIMISQNLSARCFQVSNIQNFRAQDIQLVHCSLTMNRRLSKKQGEYNQPSISLTPILPDSEYHHSQHTNMSSLTCSSTLPSNPSLYISISHSKFLHSPFWLTVEGVAVTFSLLHCTIESQLTGLGIKICLYQPTFTAVNVENSSFMNANPNPGFEVLDKSSSTVGSGLSICFTRTSMTNSSLYINAPNLILDCTLIESNFANCYDSAVDISSQLTIKLIIISCNVVGSGRSGVKVAQDYVSHTPWSHYTLIIDNCNLNNNKLHGLSSQTLNAEVTLIDSMFNNNSFSGIFVTTTYFASPGRVNITNCTVQNNLLVGIIIQPVFKLNATISRSVISYNEKPLNVSSKLEHINHGASAAAIMITCPENDDESFVTITNSTFEANIDYALEPKIVKVFQCSKIFLNGHNKFINNAGTPLEAYKSLVTISGHVEFINNTAYRGGGLTLVYSKLFLERNSFTVFKHNNVTDVGGGVYYPSILEDQDKFCFYQVNISQVPIDKLNITVQFSANSALNGGEAIFGAAFEDNCRVDHSAESTSSNLYNHIFKFDTYSARLSSFSSEPTRVCFCNISGFPQCKNKSFILFHSDQPIYPGEMITLSAVVVGKGFGSASGSVYASPIPPYNNVGMEPNQYSQGVQFNNCSTLQYTIRSLPERNVTLVFTASVASTQSVLTDSNVKYLVEQYKVNNSDELLTIPVYATMYVEHCPFGFSLSADSQPACECADILKDFGITNCTIRNHTGLIERSGSVWVGMINGELAVHKYCPYGYCRSDSLLVNPNHSDTQCSSNRTGVLCGRCKSGFSLALGTDKCLAECSDNRYVTLIIPMLLGTLMLAVIIKLFDLTVANGMINSLIFYANIMWANKRTLFTSTDSASTDSASTMIYVVQVILAWLNLDFGFEACFIKDMDAIGKTWVHFGQDILGITGVFSLIVIISYRRQSAFVTKIFGNNIVPVLASILFLSCTKLLQTIVDTLSFATFELQNETYSRWLLDGSVAYFGPQHSILFVIAIISFVLLWLPYTVILLFGQRLRRKSNCILLRWMNRLKPCFDAYYGPFEDRYHYWFGWLLVARSALLVVNAVTSAISPQANLLAIVVIGGCLLVHPYQYKKWICSFLDKIFCLNLIIVACVVLYCNLTICANDSVPPVILASMSVSLCFAILMAVWNCIKKITGQQDRRRGYDNIGDEGRDQQDDNSMLREPPLDLGDPSSAHSVN